MDVISISLPEELLAEMEGIIERRKFKGRSEMIRTALRQFAQENKPLEGHVHGSITISFPHEREARISEVRHAFHEVVLSLMHTHCEKETCMDVLLVGGDAKRVQDLFETLRRMRDVHKASFFQVA